MTIILRIFQTTIRNIFRHGFTSLTATLIMALLFLFFNAIIFASFAQSTALTLVNERLDLALTFNEQVDEFQVNSLRAEMQTALPEIRKITFVSADEAFEGFLSDFQTTNPDLADWLTHNSRNSPLPATLVISASADYHQPILDYLATSRFASLLDLTDPATGGLATTTTAKIITLDRTLTRLSLLATLTFGLLTLLIIIAVLRLTITSRQTEITIMRLTGATRQFIQLPFILEGVFFGMTATLLGAGTFFFGLRQIDPAVLSDSLYGGLGELLQITTTDYTARFITVFGWQIVAAILVGILASMLATRKYLGRELVLN